MATKLPPIEDFIAAFVALRLGQTGPMDAYIKAYLAATP